MIEEAVGYREMLYRVSPGQGNWATVPWIGIFNPEVTQTAQNGPYVVFLFDLDTGTVHLGQGQGVTVVESEFGANAQQELLRRAALIRQRVPEHARHFSDKPISMPETSRLTQNYKAAMAYSRSYALSSLPDEQSIVSDVRQLLDLYVLLVSRGGTVSLDSIPELQDTDDIDYKESVYEKRRRIRHYQLERNQTTSRKVKKLLGTTCQACGFNFEEKYGEIGKGFIEAHHKIPLHTLEEGKSVSMDLRTDFAVLCANCHRMVHNSKPALSIEELVERLNRCRNEQ